MDIWDWELLGDNSENRIQKWKFTYINKLRELTGIEVGECEANARLAELCNHNFIFRAIAELQNFWLFGYWVATTRLFRTWYQDLNEDKKHLLHARCKLYLLLNRERWVNGNGCPSLYFSWSVPTSFCHLKFYVGGEDRSVMISLACKLFVVWLAIENVLPSWLANKISKYDHERITGISFHDGILWLDFWCDDSGYSSGWKGIDVNLNVVDFLLGRAKFSQEEILKEDRMIEIEPGENYLVKIKFVKVNWRRRWTSSTDFQVEIKPNIPIPIPGKGENSWDIDDDAIYESSISAKSLNEGILKFIANIKRDRIRYGGVDWKPANN